MLPKELWSQRNLEWHIVVALSVRQSVRRPALCPVHISFTLWGRNPKFSVCMHLGITKIYYHPWVTLTLTFDLVLEYSCVGHISYHISGKNSKLGVWMHLGMTNCHVPSLGHVDLDRWTCFQNNHLWSIYPILFELGISHLVCSCILGYRVSYTSFGVTVTLTYFLELSCKEHISFILRSRNPKFSVWVHPCMVICCGPF